MKNNSWWLKIKSGVRELITILKFHHADSSPVLYPVRSMHSIQQVVSRFMTFFFFNFLVAAKMRLRMQIGSSISSSA